MSSQLKRLFWPPCKMAFTVLIMFIILKKLMDKMFI